MNPTVAKAQFCPRCHSPAVEFGTVIVESGPAKCNACGWAGTRKELLVTPYMHNMGSDEQVLTQFVSDFRGVFTKECAVAIGRWLARWGFLAKDDPKEQAKALAKYMTNISRACITAILETRQAIEKEKKNVS
jgi:hypothetical protein